MNSTPPGDNCDSVKTTLISVSDAIKLLMKEANTATAKETVRTSDALGRILAEDRISSINVPPADNSAMDGYAIHSTDLNDGAITSLPVSQRICAGSTGDPLEAGTAARIFTGAPIPAGADLVVMQEHCQEEDGKVEIETSARAGQNIRRAGEDIQQGGTLLERGTKMRPQELGLAASVGLAELPVLKRLKVAIFSTGDELCEPGEQPKPGQIYNSNRYTLTGLLASAGCEIVDLGAVEDTLEATRESLSQATSKADLIISTGGVSVGEEDHVRAALEDLGKLQMWRINMKPGKPLAFGTIGSTPFIGLPGNPVSVFVTFLIFALPFIQKMQGRAQTQSQTYRLPANFSWLRPGSRMEFLRARINDDHETPRVDIFSHQGSGVLTSTCWGDGLVLVPPETAIKEGDPVEFMPFGQF